MQPPQLRASLRDSFWKTWLENMAGDLDLLERQITENARHLATQFERAADDAEKGVFFNDPTGSSSIRHMAEQHIRLKVLREVFVSTMEHQLGKDFHAAFAESFKGFRKAE